MNLQGSQRGGAKDLALHLLKDDNEHVEIHELRGFVSDDLVEALNEAYAVSRGTKAKQFLFSVSFNPPPQEKVSTEEFEAAIQRVEDHFGLTSQPRGIIFHEKNGRRHAHCVWSRIDTKAMKAIHLPFTKRDLREISRELYIEHGWQMPRGYMNSKERDPKNFTMAQWQQAKRIGKDPREIKAALQDCWAVSDSQAAFQQALKDRGYVLAKGDQRGFVAIDHRCEIFSISKKWIGVNAKGIRTRLTDQENLPYVDQAKEQIAKDMQGHITALKAQHDKALQAHFDGIEQKRIALVQLHIQERQVLKERQEQRCAAENLRRQERYRKGLKGLLDRVTGKHRQIRERNEQEVSHLPLLLSLSYRRAALCYSKAGSKIKGLNVAWSFTAF